MIDEIELKKASNFYNIKCKLLPNQNIIIAYNGDDWLADYNSLTKKFILYHKNLRKNKTHKCQYHYQRSFKDIWYMLRYIKEHKRDYGCYRKLYKMNKLFEKLEENSAKGK